MASADGLIRGSHSSFIAAATAAGSAAGALGIGTSAGGGSFRRQAGAWQTAAAAPSFSARSSTWAEFGSRPLADVLDEEDEAACSDISEGETVEQVGVGNGVGSSGVVE